jgi:hypothetical protein
MLLWFSLAYLWSLGRLEGLAYRDLEDELLVVVGGLKSVENGGELLGVELHCRGRQLDAAGSCTLDRVEATEAN